MNWRRAGLAGGLVALGALGYMSWAHKQGPSSSWTLTGNALAGSLGEVVTFTRDSGASCLAPDGTMSSLAGDAPCLNGQGFLSERAATNLLPYSEDLTTGWAKTTGTQPTVTANNVVAPNGTQTADTLADNATATTNFGLYQSYTYAAGAHTFSAFVKAYPYSADGGAANSCFSMTFQDNATTGSKFNASTCTVLHDATNYTGAATLYSNGWCRVSTTGSPGAGAGTPEIWVESDCTTSTNHTMVGTAGTNAVTVTAIQLETGSAATSYKSTAAASAIRSATAATASNTLADGGAAWCVGSDYMPEAAFASLPSEQGLLQIGLASVTTNIIQFSIDTTSGKPKLVVYDSTGATKQILADSAISAARHRLFGCSNSGTLTLWVDGVLVAGTSSGAGTGTVAIQQSTVYLGSLALTDGGATNQAQGWLSNVVLIPQGTPQ